jgi:quercetin dioxygenase-like cupin family protein
MLESTKIERKALLTAVMDGVQSIERVEVKSITLAPAQRTGLHVHPCTVVGYVVEGTITFQTEGQPAKVLKQGDAFHEAVRHPDPLFRQCIRNRIRHLRCRLSPWSRREQID